MSQVLIDRATLEQLVVALNNAEDALNNSQALIAGRERFGFAKTCYATNEITLGFVSPAITAGRKALANAEPAGWKPIETAPKDGTSFMAGWFDGPSNPGCNMRPVKRYMGAWWESNEDYKVRTPTHWMPLPAAPKEQQ